MTGWNQCAHKQFLRNRSTVATENQSHSADTGQCRFVQKLCSVLQPVNTLQVTLTSVCASAHSSWDPALSTASPLGQPRLLFIRTTRSEPSILERSSLACSPQSVQYMYLKTDIYIIHHHILYPVLSCTKQVMKTISYATDWTLYEN